MNSITSSTPVTFSLESGNLENLMSYPVTGKQIIKSKLKMAVTIPLILNVLFTVVFSLVTILVNCFDILLVLQVWFFSSLASVLTAYVGMLCGLKWPKLHYENEMQVFKNSASTNLTMLFCMVPAAILGAGAMILDMVGSIDSSLYLLKAISLLVIIIIYTVAILVIRAKLNKHGENMFKKLSEK